MEEKKEKSKYELKYGEMELAELGEAMKSKKDELVRLKETMAEVQGHFDALRKHIVPEKMEKSGIESVKLTGVGRLSVRGELYASIDSKSKFKAYEWLKNNGYSDVVKMGVNPSTLKASVKECIENGVELPDELFEVTPFMMAVITKN